MISGSLWCAFWTIALIFYFRVVASLEHSVPVLLMSGLSRDTRNLTVNNSPEKITRTNFEHILLNNVRNETWTLLIFWLGNLCFEDLERNDKLVELANAESAEIFRNIEPPLLEFNSRNFSKDEEAKIRLKNNLEVITGASFSNEIIEKYKTRRNSDPNLIAVVTATSCKSDPVSNDGFGVTFETETFRFHSKGFLWKGPENFGVRALGKPRNLHLFYDHRCKSNQYLLTMQMHLPQPVSELRFIISKNKCNKDWSINRIEAIIEQSPYQKQKIELASNDLIEFPFNLSYRSSIPKYYSEGEVNLTLLDLQIRVGERNDLCDGNYNRDEDCNNLFEFNIGITTIMTAILFVVIFYAFNL